MPILALNPRSQGSEVAGFFPTPLTLPKTLTTRSAFYFSDTAMNSEWSSLVRVYSFPRVFQLVWGKGALSGRRHQLWSAPGKAGWQLVGAALRVATNPGPPTDATVFYIPSHGAQRGPVIRSDRQL